MDGEVQVLFSLDFPPPLSSISLLLLLSVEQKRRCECELTNISPNVTDVSNPIGSVKACRKSPWMYAALQQLLSGLLPSEFPRNSLDYRALVRISAADKLIARWHLWSPEDESNSPLMSLEFISFHLWQKFLVYVTNTYEISINTDPRWLWSNLVFSFGATLKLLGVKFYKHLIVTVVRILSLPWRI